MPKIVSFGEMLIRLATGSQSLFMQEGRFDASACGAEANVAVALAGLGHDSGMITVLPKNPLGAATRAELRKFGVSVEGIAEGAGRMGLYFLEAGAMARPSQILYDRAHSAFANLTPEMFDWPRLLQGADWLFVGGITAALGDGPLAALRESMVQARAQGVKIAFDCNFRPSLWAGREEQAAGIFYKLSCQADLLFAGRRAIAMMTGRSFDNFDPVSGFREACDVMFADASHLSHVAATRREVIASDHHRLTALISDRGECAVTETAELRNIVDRIGTGDAFAAGVLHGVIREMTLDDCANFALSAAQWSHSVRGDFLRANLADIESIRSGGGDVRR